MFDLFECMIQCYIYLIKLKLTNDYINSMKTTLVNSIIVSCTNKNNSHYFGDYIRGIDMDGYIILDKVNIMWCTLFLYYPK